MSSVANAGRAPEIMLAPSLSGPRLILLTLDDVADLLKVSRRSVERMTASGELPSLHVGARSVRVRLSVLEDFLDRRETADG